MDVQRRNLESSILFMQQEHSNTLKGLHQEISKLQKRCSELNFQLASITPEDNEDYKLQIKVLTAERESDKGAIKQLQSELTSRDQTIKTLKDEGASRDRSFLAQLRTKDAKIADLSSQLDTQSEHVAYLATELHKLKVVLRSDQLAAAPPVTANSRTKRHKPPPMSPRELSSVTPVPPSTPNPLQRRAASMHPREYTLAQVRPRSRGGDTIDIVDELLHGSERVGSPVPSEADSTTDHFVRFKPAPPVLPPIAGGGAAEEGGASSRRFMRRQLRRQITGAAVAAAAPGAANQPAANEVPTLAVEQISPQRKPFASEPRPADCS